MENNPNKRLIRNKDPAEGAPGPNSHGREKLGRESLGTSSVGLRMLRFHPFWGKKPQTFAANSDSDRVQLRFDTNGKHSPNSNCKIMFQPISALQQTASHEKGITPNWTHQTKTYPGKRAKPEKMQLVSATPSLHHVGLTTTVLTDLRWVRSTAFCDERRDR